MRSPWWKMHAIWQLTCVLGDSFLRAQSLLKACRCAAVGHLLAHVSCYVAGVLCALRRVIADDCGSVWKSVSVKHGEGSVTGLCALWRKYFFRPQRHGARAFAPFCRLLPRNQVRVAASLGE
jgi:hypothetical protein